jgi:serine/threonine-protein kinase
MADDFSRIRAALSDSYVIDREVGRGGMATVYLAEDLKHGRRVAIKVLHPDIAASLGRERFLREIEIVANLRHAGILPLYDSGEADGLLYYVMPFVEGPSHRDRLDKEKQLPVEEALRITTELAAALDEAHGHGVIHRDIKPENVLFEGDQPLIADFGVATALEEAGGEKLTRTGVAVGTPSYMSPEQAGGGETDARSDEYALACVLYEMLGGVPPFTGPTPQAVMARHALESPPDLGIVRPTVSEGVAAAVEKAMAKVPADRYPSAGAFAEALEKGEEKRAVRGPKRPSRLLTLGLPVAAVLVALLGYGIWSTGRSAVPAAASKMAILPLTTVEGDSTLEVLGKKLANLLARNLDGVGDIQTERPIGILSAVGDRILTEAEAAELARKFGASSALTGTLTREGESVRADALLLASDSTMSFLADVSARAPADSVTSLADALTRALLEEIWSKGRPPSPQVEAALGTDSLKALRRFLEGELAYARGNISKADAAYLEAFQYDSTFWLAAAMYALSWRWAEHSNPDIPPADPRILASLADHADELPEPQRSWITTAPWRFGLNAVEHRPGAAWPALFEEYEALARREWDFWPIVIDYGDHVLHFGALYGQRKAKARQAFERGFELNPDLGDVWAWHLEWSSFEPSPTDWDEAVAYVASISDNRLRDTLMADPVGMYFFCKSYLSQPRDTATHRRLREALLNQPTSDGELEAREVVPGGPALWARKDAYDQGTPRCLPDWYEPRLDRETDPVARAWYRFNAANGWAAVGAWDSAFQHIEALLKGSDATTALAAYRLGVAGAWLGYVDAAAMKELRPLAERAARRTDGPPDPELPYLLAELSWLDGILAFVSNDIAGLRRARSDIPGNEDWVFSRFERSLAAFQLYLEGDRAAAADSLYSLEMAVADEGELFLWTSSNFEEIPVLRSLNRLAASRWLLAEGDSLRAEKLLYWHEAWMIPSFKVSGFAAGLAYLELGRIHEGWGLLEGAREFYLHFLRTDPIDDYAELRTEARAAVARIDEELAVRTAPTGAGET